MVLNSKDHETEQKRGRLSYVDWFLLLLVAVLLFVGVQYLSRRRQAAQPDVTVTYTLLLSGVENSDAGGISPVSQIAVGAAVYSENGTAMLGTVTGCTSEEHFAAVVQDGEVVTVAVPGKADIYVTVRGDAIQKTGDGLRINDIRIAAGMTGSFRLGRYFAQNATILTVKREGKA